MRLRKILLLALLFSSSNLILAQKRPLPIEQVRPLIDSVQREVDRIYRLSVANQKAIEFFHKRENHLNSLLTFTNKDTTCVLLLDEHQRVLMTIFYRGEENELLKTEQIVRELSEEESILFQAKQKALEEAKRDKYAIQAPEECKMEYLFHPNKFGYTLHAISIPLVDSILPIGHDHYFLFDQEVNLLSHTQTKQTAVHSIRQKDNPPHSRMMMLSAPTNHKTNNFSILVPYFYKYRRYHRNLGLTVYQASINKRSLSYDAINNKISIELFPIEKQ